MKGRNISIIVFDIVLLGVLVFGNIMFAKAYGGSQPAVAGHTLGEILPGTFGAGDYTFPQNLFVNGNLGVGTATPRAKLDLGNSGGNMFVLNPGSATAPNYLGYVHDDLIMGSYISGAYFQGFISFGHREDVNRRFHIGSASNGVFDGSTAFVPALTVTSGGNVGIGTTSPGYILDIYGDAKYTRMIFPSATSYTGLVFYEGASFRNYIQSIGSLYSDATRRNDLEINSIYGDVTLQKDSGNVGIGTASPQSKLDVNGGILSGGKYVVVDQGASGKIGICRGTRTSGNVPAGWYGYFSIDYFADVGCPVFTSNPNVFWQPFGTALIDIKCTASSITTTYVQFYCHNSGGAVSWTTDGYSWMAIGPVS